VLKSILKKLARFKKYLPLIAGAATIIIIAANFFSVESFLTLQSTDKGNVFVRFPIVDNAEFSIEFIHSVNQAPVRDVFIVSEGEILPIATYFYAFGAGMQTELEAEQSLNYHQDGSMSITGFTQRFAQLNYIVGTVSDHILTIGGERVSLRELCGSNAAVTFKIEERLKLEFRKQ